MFRAAQLVGEAVQIANETVGKALASIKISGASSILLGGRIGDGPPSLYLIYSAGNFIECKPDVPFFQIGETKYGRPILDRTITPATSLAEAMKVAFLSFDSSIRSNLAVARPLDLIVMPTRPGARPFTRRIGVDGMPSALRSSPTGSKCKRRYAGSAYRDALTVKAPQGWSAIPATTASSSPRATPRRCT